MSLAMDVAQVQSQLWLMRNGSYCFGFALTAPIYRLMCLAVGGCERGRSAWCIAGPQQMFDEWISPTWMILSFPVMTVQGPFKVAGGVRLFQGLSHLSASPPPGMKVGAFFRKLHLKLFK